ncbi:hypothetical protein GW17_00052843 [Ensete ventricosum]|nr:hypothetical protein GW17_00052843 [Ensete ventricosum]RZS23932.1 hypothetical protein BHM03_00056956 [Ensete ventricosum]
MGYHRRALFAAISLLFMLVTRPATVQSVSRGAPPRSLIVHGGKVSRSLLRSAVCTIIGGVKVIHPNRDPSGCHIVNGQKVCDPPIPGRSREP